MTTSHFAMQLRQVAREQLGNGKGVARELLGPASLICISCGVIARERLRNGWAHLHKLWGRS